MNDVFKITDIINSDYKITIFNRWGLQVFESNSTNRHWHGNFNGSPVADGIYYWILDFQNYCGGKVKAKKGFVSLFR